MRGHHGVKAHAAAKRSSGKRAAKRSGHAAKRAGVHKHGVKAHSAHGTAHKSSRKAGRKGVARSTHHAHKAASRKGIAKRGAHHGVKGHTPKTHHATRTHSHTTTRKAKRATHPGVRGHAAKKATAGRRGVAKHTARKAAKRGHSAASAAVSCLPLGYR